MAKISQLYPGVRLQPRQLQVSDLAAHGLSNKEIATRLDLSEETVKTYVHRAFQAMHITGGRNELMGKLFAAQEQEIADLRLNLCTCQKS